MSEQHDLRYYLDSAYRTLELLELEGGFDKQAIDDTLDRIEELEVLIATEHQ